MIHHLFSGRLRLLLIVSLLILGFLKQGVSSDVAQASSSPQFRPCSTTQLVRLNSGSSTFTGGTYQLSLYGVYDGRDGSTFCGQLFASGTVSVFNRTPGGTADLNMGSAQFRRDIPTNNTGSTQSYTLTVTEVSNCDVSSLEDDINGVQQGGLTVGACG